MTGLVQAKPAGTLRLESVLFALLLLAICTVPLALAPGWLYYDITPKVVATLLGGTAACLWLSVRPVGNTNPDRLLTWATTFYVLVLILFTIVSTAPSISLGGGVWRRFGLIVRLASIAAAVVLFFAIQSRPLRWLWSVRATSFTVLLMSIYGIAQYFGYDPWINPESYREPYWGTLRPPSTAGRATFSATILVAGAFVALSISRKGAVWIDRSLGYSTAVVALFAAYLSGTRAALLGLIGGLVVIWIAGRRRLTLGLISAVTVSCIAVFAVYASSSGEYLRARVTEWATDTGGPRSLLWRDVLTMVMSRPATGFGLETFTAQFPALQSAQLGAAYPEHHHESPHNIFLDALVEQGIPGLAALLALLAAAVRAGLRALPEARDQASAVLAAITALVIAQQFTAFTIATHGMLLTLIALCAALSYRSFDPQPVGTYRLHVRLTWLLPAVLFAGAALEFSRQDAKLGMLQRLMRQGEITEALAEFRLLDDASIGGERPDLWYSRRLSTSVPPNAPQDVKNQAWKAAVAAAVQATRRSEERHNAHFQAAYLYALAEDSANAEYHLRGAIAWAPQWYKPHWFLSRLLRITGREAEAVKEEALARSLSGKLPLQ